MKEKTGKGKKNGWTTSKTRHGCSLITSIVSQFNTGANSEGFCSCIPMTPLMMIRKQICFAEMLLQNDSADFLTKSLGVYRHSATRLILKRLKFMLNAYLCNILQW